MTEQPDPGETGHHPIQPDEWCGVTCAVQVLDHKWHLVIVKRLLECPTLRFNELLDAIDEITNKTLSDSLADLEEKGLVERTVIDARPVRVEYTLTEHGRSLAPVIDVLEMWGVTHAKWMASKQSAGD